MHCIAQRVLDCKLFILCSHTYISTPIIMLALVITEQRCFAGRKKKRASEADGEQAGTRSAESSSDEPMKVIKKSVVSGIVTRIDLLEYISHANVELSEE